MLCFAGVGHAQNVDAGDKPAAARAQEGQDAAQEPGTHPPAAADTLLYEPRYHDLEEVQALLETWASAHAGVRLIDLGLSRGGRRVPAIEIRRIDPPDESGQPDVGSSPTDAAGANLAGRDAVEGAAAAGTPAATGIDAPVVGAGLVGNGDGGAALGSDGAWPSRSTLFLIGGLDGRSLCGSEAVLATCAQLIDQLEELREDVAVIAVPWAAPDGLAAIYAGRRSDGLNDRSLDADRDGNSDEDGPDDLDGDGLILSMLIEDPTGPWTFGEDARLIVPARRGDRPRLILAPEGRDDDGDGRFNEDGAGGVNLDENFPIAWEGVIGGGAGGELPLSEPLARRLADLMVSRATALVIVMQGAHGGIARPRTAALPGVAASFFEGLPALWSRMSERSLAGCPDLCAAAATPRPGTLIDWASACLGVPAFELAVWGPGDGLEPSAETQGAPSGALAASDDVRLERERAWLRWLDDKRGGIGFVPWQSVRLEGGQLAHVGGWLARTRLNPAQEELAQALMGCDAFVTELLGLCSVPRLELQARRIEGDLVALSARVLNDGLLPMGSGRLHGGGLELELLLPDGVRLLAGEQRVHLAALAGESASTPLDYLLIVPAGALIQVRVRVAGAKSVTEELRP